VHEIKHDGYRLQVRREGEVVRLFTRNGKTYRRLRTNPEAPATGIVDFCGTDWSVERETVAAARRYRPR
jgi:hypothetical protein